MSFYKISVYYICLYLFAFVAVIFRYRFFVYYNIFLSSFLPLYQRMKARRDCVYARFNLFYIFCVIKGDTVCDLYFPKQFCMSLQHATGNLSTLCNITFFIILFWGDTPKSLSRHILSLDLCICKIMNRSV